VDSDSEVENFIAPKPSRFKAAKTATQTQHREPSPKATRTIRGRATQSQKKSQPLFIQSDDEDDNAADADFQMEDDDEAGGASQPPAVEEDEEDAATLRSNPRSQASRSKAAGKKRHAPALASDSDDELAFQGFGVPRTGRRR
jgi:hypothetical protein